MKRIVLLLLSLYIFTACDSKAPLQFQNPGARANSSISASFAVENVATAQLPANVDKAKITLQKSALNKEFLLQASMIQQEMLPNFGGMKSRIVFFRQVENKVYMIEASKGLLLPKDYPQVLPIAEFDVTTETATALTFDFNRGMSRLFQAGDWTGRDFGAGGGGYVSVPVAFSYIDSARLTASNQIEIRQVALLNMSNGRGNTNVPVEVAYYLKPYAPNPAFVPTIAPDDMNHMGFFEVDSQFNDVGGSVSFAAKMDISKPVVYALSSNTPAEFKDAIREGILYWNKAFGREVVKVVDAPTGMFAPNPEYNIVQWSEVDRAGFAYADAQMDPRTGEVLHHQIYFASGWRRAARGEMLDYIKTGQVARAGKAKISLTGFEPNSVCNMDVNAAVAAELSKIASTEQDAAKVQKASADLLRFVTAHEVGHTLGLRHNFAGSLAASYAVDQREVLFKNYMDSGSAPADLVTSSSVMDYQNPIESFMHGDQVLKLPKASAYDEKAIRFLYLGEKFSPSELPLFCTDTQMRDYSDCTVFDAGASYVAWMKYSAHHQLDSLPYTLLNSYVAAKAPSFNGLPREISTVAFDPRIAALMGIGSSADLVSMLHKDSKLLSVERKYPYVNSANADDIRRETVDLLLADLARNGQFEEVLVQTTPAVVDRLAQKYETLLNDPKLIRGVTVEGKAYEFSAEELKIMKDYGRVFFGRLRGELARVEVQTLNGDSPIVELYKEWGFNISMPARPAYDMNDLSQNFATYAQKRAEDILLATSGEPLVFKRNVGSEWSLPPGSKAQAGSATPEVTTYSLPRFAYPLALRKQAAGILRSDRAESPIWGYSERITLAAAFEKVVSDALPGVSVKDSGTVENYPREITKFILENREVRSAINKP